MHLFPNDPPEIDPFADDASREPAATPVTEDTSVFDLPDMTFEQACAIARAMADTEEYRTGTVPDDVRSQLGDSFKDSCYLPPARASEIAEHIKGCASALDLVSLGWRAAQQENAVRYYENKVVFPVPVMRTDGTTPLEVSMRFCITPTTRNHNLFPWIVVYVNDYVKPAGSTSDAPSKEIERFAWLGAWDALLAQLADAALDEEWDFQGAPDANGHSRAILKSYLCTTFYRLKLEDKIAIAPDGSLAAFNTGLVNNHYDDLYACFEPSTGALPWRFAGFTSAGSRGLGKQLVSLFNPLPETATYFTRKEDMLFDLDKEPIIDYNHVIIDNIERLPLEFLSEELRNCPEAVSILEEIAAIENAPDADKDAQTRLYSELGEIVQDDARLFRRLRLRVADAVEIARRRVRWNFKTAIPSYYPRGNTMSLLLPLCLVTETEADAALVVQLMPSGNYQGQTILTMRQAYANARLICRPDSDWLTTTSRNASL